MLASALAATPLFIAVAKASPNQMFVISTPAAGVVDFRGTGAASFTNTTGSTDSITIGANSSFGVSATGSNSSDYTSSASSSLDLAATTSLNHASGTATQAFNLVYAGTAATADTKITDAVAKISSVSTTRKSGDGTAVLDDLKQNMRDIAGATADSIVGTDKDTKGSSNVDYSGDQNLYDAAWKSVYNEEYAKAYDTANTASGTSYSHDLAVTGIGTITNVDAAASSKFTASTQRLDGSTTIEGGTGSASAVMTNSNATFANTAETASATAFAQAFNGGNPTPPGDLVLTGVTGDSTSGYVVSGTRTSVSTEKYNVASDGSITKQ